MKLTSTNAFLQVSNNVDVARGKIWNVRRMFSASQPNLWSLSFTRLAVCGREVSCKRMTPSDSISGRFDFYGASQHPQPPRNEPHLSALDCLPPFPMLDERALYYAHLQNNKETTVRTCAFSLCMSPTLQMAVYIRNNSVASVCEECVLWRVFGFHLTTPYIISDRRLVWYHINACMLKTFNNLFW